MSILNDLFGIQSRGGCSCAGPYGHRLLGIDLERSHEFEREITGGCEGIKPGWVRVNFNYFVSDTVFEYVVQAVAMVADHGWKLVPQYRFDPATGLWQPQGRHRRAAAAAAPALVRRRRRAALPAQRRPRAGVDPGRAPGGGVRHSSPRCRTARGRRRSLPPVSADFDHLRWFDLPAVCLERS